MVKKKKKEEEEGWRGWMEGGPAVCVSKSNMFQ